MKDKGLRTIKNNSFTVFLLALGFLILYWTKDYKEVPSGIGPAFFPRIVAWLLIVLSVIGLLLSLRKEGGSGSMTVEKSASVNILISVVSLTVMVGIMKYIHPLVGIALFLLVYLKVIAKLKWVQTLIITGAGTVVLYLVILALRIPL